MAIVPHITVLTPDTIQTPCVLTERQKAKGNEYNDIRGLVTSEVVVAFMWGTRFQLVLGQVRSVLTGVLCRYKGTALFEIPCYCMAMTILLSDCKSTFSFIITIQKTLHRFANNNQTAFTSVKRGVRFLFTHFMCKTKTTRQRCYDFLLP